MTPRPDEELEYQAYHLSWRRRELARVQRHVTTEATVASLDAAIELVRQAEHLVSLLAIAEGDPE